MKYNLVCDIDGILAHLTAKQKGFLRFKPTGGNWEKDYYCDIPLQEPIPNFIPLVERLWRDDNWFCCFSTGRSEKFRKETSEWLLNHLDITFSRPNDQLRMRDEKDFSSSPMVKEKNIPFSRQLNFAIEDEIECQRMYMDNDYFLIG